MKLILMVAFAGSVHTQRWLDMISGEYRVVLVPSTSEPRPSVSFAHCPIRSAEDLQRMPGGSIGLWLADTSAEETPPDDLPAPIDRPDRSQIVRGATIARAIRELRPDILHALETQHAGYACLAAKRILGPVFPPWLLSNWGSDIFLYQRLASHRPTLQAVARAVDAVINECERDSNLIRALGFEGLLLPPQPASGGTFFDRMPPLAGLVPPSARREIVVKGYHGWAGRGLHILSAIHLAGPVLRGYRIRLLFAGPSATEMVPALVAADRLEIVAERWLSDHGTALERLAAARMVISSGISDGIGTTLLEAMSLGAFPLATDGCCGDEWLRNGVDGCIVPTHDVAALSTAIARAATDDALVDAAARRNRQTVEARWDARVNRVKALDAYRAVSDAFGERRSDGR